MLIPLKGMAGLQPILFLLSTHEVSEPLLSGTSFCDIQSYPRPKAVAASCGHKPTSATLDANPSSLLVC